MDKLDISQKSSKTRRSDEDLSKNNPPKTGKKPVMRQTSMDDLLTVTPQDKRTMKRTTLSHPIGEAMLKAIPIPIASRRPPPTATSTPNDRSLETASRRHKWANTGRAHLTGIYGNVPGLLAG